MKVYCHGIEVSKDGLITYKGLNVIENVDEVVIYNLQERITDILDKADCQAVAIFAPTVFVMKKGNKYHWSDVRIEVKNPEMPRALQNGKNYVKEKGRWMLLQEN